MKRRLAKLAALSAGMTIFAIGAIASPSYAATTINADEPQAGCTDDGAWVFQLGFLDPGETAPASIQAELVGGSFVTANRQNESFGWAYYTLPGDTTPRPTGAATADIDFVWLPTDNFFLAGGPCTKSAATIDTNGPIVVHADTITVTGVVKDADGNPIVGQKGHLRYHSPVALGKGDFKEIVTDANGTFAEHFPATDLGFWDFWLEFLGSGALDDAIAPTMSNLKELWVVPATSPTPQDVLASSAGTTSHVTTVSGGGFDTNSDVVVLIYSAPSYLATVKADDTGNFSADITIPSSFSGDHTIVAIGSSEGELRSLALGVKLPELAKTGASLTRIVAGGVALVIIGAVMLLLGVRRRSARTRVE